MKKNLTVWNLFSVVILAAFALFIMYPIFLILYRSAHASEFRPFLR